MIPEDHILCLETHFFNHHKNMCHMSVISDRWRLH